MYPTLETERITLRPWEIGDETSLYENLKDLIDVTEVGWPVINSIEKAKWIVEDNIKDDNQWAIVQKADDKLIGWFGISSPNKKRVLIWAYIFPEYRNKGFCTEALTKAIHFTFYGIETNLVITDYRVNNPLAGVVLKKCSFTEYEESKSKTYFRLFREDYIKQNHVVASSYDYKQPAPLVKAKSHYSFDNPIRRIDSIAYIKQPTEYLCGQAVIAMLAGVSVDEVVSVMQNDKGTSTQELRNALKWYGIKTATNARLKYLGEIKLPDCCILSIMLPGYGHWSLYYNGKYYDPEFGVLDKLPEQAKLRYYWEVII